MAQVPESGSITLTGEEGRHAVSVRRMRQGESLMITDGRGTWAIAQVQSVRGRDTVELQVLDSGWEAPATPAVTVVQALPKGDRGPLAVELLTEVGVDRIVPWQAARCVSRWTAGSNDAGDKADKGRQRWQRVAQEAAKQSRRVWVPEVAALADTHHVAKLCSEASLAVVCHEMADQPLTDAIDQALGDIETSRVRSASSGTEPTTDDADGIDAGGIDAGGIVIVIGPEGSITEEEMQVLRAAGGRLAGMGPTVMRTSSAGAVAAAVVMARSGRWRATSPPAQPRHGP